MQKTKPLAAIFFDLDGTLVDSRKDVVLCANHCLKELGLAQLPEKQIAGYVGWGRDYLLEKVLGPEHQDKKSSLLDLVVDYYSKHLFDNTTLYPDVIPILQHFSGSLLAVLSNKSLPFVDKTLVNFKIAEFFKYIIGGDNPEELKPSAHHINTILKQNNIAKRSALMVGDMPLDVETGNNAGITTYAVDRGFASRGALLSAKAGYLEHDLNPLKQLFHPAQD